MKKDPFTRSGHPLVSKVVYDGSLKESIALAVSLIGGMNKVIRKGDIVLLKPNYNTADPLPGSGDPEFIKAVIELLYQAGASKVVLGERTAFCTAAKPWNGLALLKLLKELGQRSKFSERMVGMNYSTEKAGDA
jgi:uncharacterized protein (DUF362 family)